jgi:hypothetical protein
MTTRKRQSSTSRNYQRKRATSIKDLKVNNYLKNADKPVSILVGLLAGSPIAIFIDKQMTAKKVFGLDGDKLKKWVKPGANFILGMSAHFLAKDPRIKLAGVGLAANGGLIALKELLGGKDLLKGLIESDSMGSTSYNVLSAAANRSISSPLNLPLLQIDEPSAEASEIIDRAINDDEDMNGIKGSSDIELGKTEDQIAGELETVYTDSDDDLDDIP